MSLKHRNVVHVIFQLLISPNYQGFIILTGVTSQKYKPKENGTYSYLMFWVFMLNKLAF